MRSDRALKTSPVFRIRRRVAPLWTRSTFSTSSVFSANGVRLPSASLIASPLPSAAWPCWSSHVEKPLAGLGVEGAQDLVELHRVGHLALGQSWPPSGIVPELLLPGASST